MTKQKGGKVSELASPQVLKRESDPNKQIWCGAGSPILEPKKKV